MESLGFFQHLWWRVSRAALFCGLAVAECLYGSGDANALPPAEVQKLIREADFVVRYVSPYEPPARALSPEAFSDLGAAAVEHADARDALIRLSRHRFSAVRSRAALAMGAVAATHADARGMLIHLSRDWSFEVRRDAAGPLGSVAVEHSDARGALIRLAGDDDWDVRARAANALGSAATLHEDARNALIRLAGDKVGNVRANAARPLGPAAVEQADARGALLRLSGDENGNVRANVALALGPAAVRHADARGTLIRLSRDSQASDVRSAAAIALGPAAVAYADARGALIRIADEKNSFPRANAARGLGPAAARHADARLALIRLAEDADAGVRHAAHNSVETIARHIPSLSSEERQALSTDLLDFVVRTKAESAERVLALLTRQDPELRLRLLRRAAGLDMPWRTRAALNGSRGRWRDSALRTLELTYDRSYEPDRATLRGAQAAPALSSTYRGESRPAVVQEAPQIEAFLAERRGYSRLDPRGPSAAERQLLDRIAASFSCPSLDQVVRQLPH